MSSIALFLRIICFFCFTHFWGPVSYAGPWGQETGQWYTQFEATAGHLQDRDFRTDSFSAFAETGVGYGMTASINHFSSFTSSASGTQQVSDFSADHTRIALQKRLLNWRSAAISAGIGHSRRAGYRPAQPNNTGGPGFRLCPEYYTDIYASVGFTHETKKKKKKTIYIFDAMADQTGDVQCRETRLNISRISYGRKWNREIYFWHTMVDETPNSDGAARISSTKYRVLHRRKAMKNGSIFFAYTVERSNRFEESSMTIGVSKRFG